MLPLKPGACLHPGCGRPIVVGAMCAYHGHLPPGMTPTPAPAFTAPYANKPTRTKKARKRRAKPKRVSPLERLANATALLNSAASDYTRGIAGAWERVESSRSLVAGAVLALHAWDGREEKST